MQQCSAFPGGIRHTACRNRGGAPEGPCATATGGRSFEVFNTGVHGYSAVQGRRQFALRVRPLESDVVTLCYGWNDHWLAGRPDSNRMALERSRVLSKLFAKLVRKRFFQFLAVRLKPREARTAGEARVLRVPRAEYRATLRSFVDDVRGRRARARYSRS